MVKAFVIFRHRFVIVKFNIVQLETQHLSEKFVVSYIDDVVLVPSTLVELITIKLVGPIEKMFVVVVLIVLVVVLTILVIVITEEELPESFQ